MTSVAPSERRLVGTGSAAAELGIDPATLWRWERKGLVKPTSRTIGGQARWDVDDLQEQVRKHLEQSESDGLVDAAPPPQEPET